MASEQTIKGRNALTIFHELDELVGEIDLLNAAILDRATEGDHSCTAEWCADMNIRLRRVCQITEALRSARPNDALDNVLGIDRHQPLRDLSPIKSASRTGVSVAYQQERS